MGRVLDIYIFGGVFIGWTSGWTHKYRRGGRKTGRVGILHLPLHLIHKFSSHSPKHLSSCSESRYRSTAGHICLTTVCISSDELKLR